MSPLLLAILIVFTEPGCPWSQKFQKEIVEHLPKELKIKEERGEFKIIVQDDEGEEIEERAFFTSFEEIQRIIQDYQEVKQADWEKSEDLERLYKLAKGKQKQRILEIGLNREKNSFFLLEQYALVRDAALRKKIEDLGGSELELAVLDFKGLQEKGRTVSRVTRPLRLYLEKDPQAWSVHLMLAEFLFCKAKPSDALKYAQNAYEYAPEEAKVSIAETIKHIINHL